MTLRACQCVATACSWFATAKCIVFSVHSSLKPSRLERRASVRVQLSAGVRGIRFYLVSLVRSQLSFLYAPVRKRPLRSQYKT